MRGIHRGPVNSPHKRPVTRKLFPFDDVIMNEGPITRKAFLCHDVILSVSLGVFYHHPFGWLFHNGQTRFRNILFRTTTHQNVVTIIVRSLACVGWVGGVASASERHKSAMIISYTWNWLFGNLQNALACSICLPIVCDQWMQKIVLRLSDTMSCRFGAF